MGVRKRERERIRDSCPRHGNPVAESNIIQKVNFLVLAFFMSHRKQNKRVTFHGE